MYTGSLALVTDFYEITMSAAYHAQGMNGMATFSLFIRDLPPQRGFIVAAGLEQVLDYLEDFAFSSQDLDYLRSLGRFEPGFLEFLGKLRFTGEVWALPEGTICFADEPLLEITAPLAEAQLVETMVINLVNLHSMLASKAARCVLAAQGRALVDFGLRRTQGLEAGMAAARAAAMVGFAGTSNVAAARELDLPPVGTMAHAFVESFGDETASFRAFAQTFPDHTVILVDTYDSVSGLKRAVEVALELKAQGHRLVGVRLDSGDMVALSRQAREMLDQAGLEETMVVVSGSLDEYRLAEMLAQGARVDLFAVGTKVVCSADAPYFDIAYKLVSYEDRPTLKLSAGKRTWVSPKQLWRQPGPDGLLGRDLLGLRGESLPGQPLLVPVMRQGRRLGPREPWREARRRFSEQLASLPEACRRLESPQRPPVEITPALDELQRRTQALVLDRSGRAF
jgi:nicotinate phosphoribosyltransferase